MARPVFNNMLENGLWHSSRVGGLVNDCFGYKRRKHQYPHSLDGHHWPPEVPLRPYSTGLILQSQSHPQKNRFSLSRLSTLAPSIRTAHSISTPFVCSCVKQKSFEYCVYVSKSHFYHQYVNSCAIMAAVDEAQEGN